MTIEKRQNTAAVQKLSSLVEGEDVAREVFVGNARTCTIEIRMDTDTESLHPCESVSIRG